MIIVNNAAKKHAVQISFQDSHFISFGYGLRSGIAGSYVSSIFNFLRNPNGFFRQAWVAVCPGAFACCRHVLSLCGAQAEVPRSQ